jgi:cytochrome P450
MTVEYDPVSPEVLADPFPAYRDLRERCPVHHNERFTPPFFTLSRYSDVRQALVDHDTWSIRYGQSPQYTRPAALVNDPPEHTAYRALFARAFTPRTVKTIEDQIDALAGTFIDAMLALGGGPGVAGGRAPAGVALAGQATTGTAAGDFHDLYACPLPTIVIAKLLGIPPEDLNRFKQMSNDLTATYNSSDPAASLRPRHAFDAYFATVIAERRAALRAAGFDIDDGGPRSGPDQIGPVLPDDLVSALVVAEVDGRRLDDHELSWILLLLLLGGNETSTALLTNLMWRLLERPERWKAVCADPALVDVAVEESLRFDPPVLGLFRTPTADTTLHEVTVPAKAKTMLCFAAANHDPSVFSHPDEFRLDRDLDDIKRHLSFGFGAHFCPGAALARLEARVTLRLLIERLPTLALTGVPERIVAFNLWGRRTLPVTW